MVFKLQVTIFNSFQIKTDLLNSEKLEVAIAQLCLVQVSNFTMLWLTQK